MISQSTFHDITISNEKEPKVEEECMHAEGHPQELTNPISPRPSRLC